MKPHRILKTFKGTQDGQGEGEMFEEGKIRHLSSHLAAVVVPAGYAELAKSDEKASKPKAKTDNSSESENVTEPTEEKALEGAPENKSRKLFKKTK